MLLKCNIPDVHEDPCVIYIAKSISVVTVTAADAESNITDKLHELYTNVHWKVTYAKDILPRRHIS